MQTRCLKNTTENKTQTKGKKEEEEQQQQPNSTRRSPSLPLPRKIQKLTRLVDKLLTGIFEERKREARQVRVG
jgi:hypothetical protein